GGGEWVAIGSIINEAAGNLGVPYGKALIAYGAGDAWTNLLQPFWAIPLLAITGLRARGIFGYRIVMMLTAAVPFAIGLTFIPY
ncbi:MAG: TIGR00366 family protein, partial [Candidimonas sp.]